MSRARVILDRIHESGGQSAGQMEIANTSLAEARKFAEKVEEQNGRDLDLEIPDFDRNYEKTKDMATQGSTLRHNMPVIETSDVRDLQDRLQNGFLDLERPYSQDTKERSNPFPEGLHGEQADKWLEDGLKKNDGDATDDVVRASQTSLTVGSLIPIQKQIYFDKSMSSTAKAGVMGTRSFLNSQIFVVSSDNHIIDGHHRYLSAMLIDPNMQVRCLVVDLPIRELLPLCKAYGDAIGNDRNG
jgi:hypothetical protein